MDQLNKTNGYIHGGQNFCSSYYDNGGFLPFASKAKFLGISEGNWYDIGLHISKGV